MELLIIPDGKHPGLDKHPVSDRYEKIIKWEFKEK